MELPLRCKMDTREWGVVRLILDDELMNLDDDEN